MRPRSFDRGNIPSKRLPIASMLRASMRPRSFDRGNHAVMADGRSDNAASMRPRSFDRGNLRITGTPSLAYAPLQ